MSLPDAEQERLQVEHAACVRLRASMEWRFFQSELRKRIVIAQRDVCAELTTQRDYHAGKLAGLAEAAALIDRKYEQLKPIVEVVS